MATGISASLNSMSCRLGRNSFTATGPSSVISLSSFLTPVTHLKGNIFPLQRRRSLKVCLVLEKKIEDGIEIEDDSPESSNRASERLARKKAERYTYLVAAMMSSLGITSMAIVAVYYRFSWQMEGGEIPVLEMLGTFALSVGAAVGMEFWARWAHKALWHASLWHMHESHHRPREGPFELNDVFAIINAVPAISLLSYGLFNKGLVPGLCFGAGLGITVFGMAYMFVHDGLVHRRFPVGPIANVPYLRKVASAHQVNHTPHLQAETKILNLYHYLIFINYQEIFICNFLYVDCSFITLTNLMEFHTGCSWDPWSWKRWEAWKSWKRRSIEELNHLTLHES